MLPDAGQPLAKRSAGKSQWLVGDEAASLIALGSILLERRLAAILAADVVGFSRLMGVNEAGTLARLQALLDGVLLPKIAEHGGRVVKLMGDGLLADFPSTVNAVTCAAQIQQTVAENEGPRGDTERLCLRIGINLGDIIIQGEDIFGDGVNVAARLEAIADPGGVCLSGTAFDTVDGKVDFSFEDLGPQSAKNIAKPLRAYRLVLGGAKVKAAPPRETLVVPDKPSLAVLPFDNMSGDPEQEYFSDGMTEDLITALSKIRWLCVIARNSSFAYKAKATDVRRVAQELGVRYVLEGSIRKAGKRIRVTAQLIDASSGVHVWAERFDREVGDIFALQDDITATLIAAIEPELAKAERQRAIAKPAENLDAWSWFQRGLWHHYRATRQDNELALQFIGKAVELDPHFSRALAALANVHYWNALFGYSENPMETLEKGLTLARRAIAADDQEPFARFALGRIDTLLGNLDSAVAELEMAIELSPSFAHAYYGLGNALNFVGRAEEAIEKIDQALRLDPHDPAVWTFMGGRAWSLFFLGRTQEAHEWAQKSVRQANAGWLAHAIAAATCAELGEGAQARAALDEALKIKPDLKLSFIAANYPFREERYLKRFTQALAKAGLAG